MRSFSKLFLIIAFIGVSAVCSAQTFSASEFVSLVYKGQDEIKDAIEAKGYNFSRTENSDMSENDIFTASGNMSVSVIFPTFEDGQKLIAWEFKNSDGLFNNLNREILSAGFKKTATESRNGYLGYTYQRPDVTIILSRDRTEDRNGIYTLSVRQMSLAGMSGAISEN